MLLPEILELLTDLRRLCELVRGQDVPDGERDGQPLLGELVTRRATQRWLKVKQRGSGALRL